jgi:hypothetical protein
MRGHSPFGWAATLLIAVAYAHVLLKLAAAVLALAVAVRLLVSPARTVMPEAVRRRRQLDCRSEPSVLGHRPVSDRQREHTGRRS